MDESNRSTRSCLLNPLCSIYLALYLHAGSLSKLHSDPQLSLYITEWATKSLCGFFQWHFKDETVIRLSRLPKQTQPKETKQGSSERMLCRPPFSTEALGNHPWAQGQSRDDEMMHYQWSSLQGSAVASGYPLNALKILLFSCDQNKT